jgi:glutamine amidotransferase
MIKIIDYGMGNVGSIGNMLLRLGGRFQIVDNPEGLRGASLVILPGVGSFDNAMSKLRVLGFVSAVEDYLQIENVKLLGICLGMQLLFEKSEEGAEEGLKLIPGEVIKFFPTSDNVKIPHMGWNHVKQVRNGTLLDGVLEDSRFYFVHSYHVACNDQWVIGKTAHGYTFPSVVCKGNVYGVQFHPEKSHRYGLALLRSFVEASDGL